LNELCAEIAKYIYRYTQEHLIPSAPYATDDDRQHVIVRAHPGDLKCSLYKIEGVLTQQRENLQIVLNLGSKEEIG
jgi:hypothetical protein